MNSSTREGRRYSERTYEFVESVREALEPIFDQYKDKFTFEEMYYLVCTQFNEVILSELLDLRKR